MPDLSWPSFERCWVHRTDIGQIAPERIVASCQFGLGHLGKRHRHASNIGRTFGFDKPMLEPPQLPDTVAIAAIPCILQGGSLGTQRPKARRCASRPGAADRSFRGSPLFWGMGGSPGSQTGNRPRGRGATKEAP